MIQGIISCISEAVAKTGSTYCTLTLLSPEADPQKVNVWSSKASQFSIGKLAVINNPKISDQGASCSFNQVSLQEAPESYKVLIPTPPTDQEWDDVLLKACSLIKDVALQVVFAKAANFLFPQFCKGTAAKANHHNYPGGLARHTYELLLNATALLPVQPYPLNSFVVLMGCLFHDAYKLYEYNPTDFSYTKYMFLVGHPVGSSEMAEAFCNKSGVDAELTLHIKHCILAHHLNPGGLNWGSPVAPATYEAFIVAMCDMISGHGTSIAQTPEGQKCFSLGTNIVKCPQ